MQKTCNIKRDCKSGDIDGTLILTDFVLDFDECELKKPSKIFTIFCMHIVNA